MSNYYQLKAKEVGDNEFYTLMDSIENELKYYKDHFKNKVVYCNCDDPEKSNFFKYFKERFDVLGLKKLITTHYNKGKVSYKLELRDSSTVIKTPLKGDGDFQSEECIEMLKKADIVVTNPPFSLFIPFFQQLHEYNKKFLIIGDSVKLSNKLIFELVRKKEVWFGVNNGNMWFRVPDNTKPRKLRYREIEGEKQRSIGTICWYTNLKPYITPEKFIPIRSFSIEGNKKYYKKYDNYDALEVTDYRFIPKDYDGLMSISTTGLPYIDLNAVELVKLSKDILPNEYTKTYSNIKRIHKGEITENVDSLNKNLVMKYQTKPIKATYYFDDNGNYYLIPTSRVIIRLVR
jgi:hypothetical protein